MATGILLEFQGVGQKDYSRVIELLGLDNNPPKGGIFHMAGPIPNGWRVVDIWESKNAFDQFYNDRLVPAFKQAGVATPIRKEYFDVYNVYTPQLSELETLNALGTLTGTRR